MGLCIYAHLSRGCRGAQVGIHVLNRTGFVSTLGQGSNSRTGRGSSIRDSMRGSCLGLNVGLYAGLYAGLRPSGCTSDGVHVDLPTASTTTGGCASMFFPILHTGSGQASSERVSSERAYKQVSSERESK